MIIPSVTSFVYYITSVINSYIHCDKARQLEFVRKLVNKNGKFHTRLEHLRKLDSVETDDSESVEKIHFQSQEIEELC